MTVVMQQTKQTKQTMMASFHSWMYQQRYTLAVNIIGIESDVFEGGGVNLDKYSVWHIQLL